MPMPTVGLIGALVFLSGVLAVAFVAPFFNGRQAREEPRSGGNSTGDNGTRNETQRQPLLRPPLPRPSVERENPSGVSRDSEDAHGEENGGGGGGGNGGGGCNDKKKLIMLIVLAIWVMLMVMMIEKGGSEAKPVDLLQLSLGVWIILFFIFIIF